MRFALSHTAAKAGVVFGPVCLALISIDPLYCLVSTLIDHEWPWAKFEEPTDTWNC